jgi:hypothetical protein
MPTPEELARENIEEQLCQAGWSVRVAVERRTGRLGQAVHKSGFEGMLAKKYVQNHW